MGAEVTAAPRARVAAICVTTTALFVMPWTMAGALPGPDGLDPTATTSTTSPLDATIALIEETMAVGGTTTTTEATSSTTTSTTSTTTAGQSTAGSSSTTTAPDSQPAGTTTGAPAGAERTNWSTTSGGRQSVTTGDAGAAGSAGQPPIAPTASVRASTSTAAPPSSLATGGSGSLGFAVPSGHPTIDRITSHRAAAAVPVGSSALHAPGGSRSTRVLLDALGPLSLTPAALARLVAPFPVVGAAHYADDFGEVRLNPFVHSHQGTDIFAARGTPVAASAAGVVSKVTTGGAGGIAIRLTATRGTYFFYAHLDGVARGVEPGQHVEKGAILGFVGTTGNAEGSSPHLHYEIHPNGGAAVNPAPILDRWLTEALDAARSVRANPSGSAAAMQITRANGDRAIASIQTARNLRAAKAAAAVRGGEQTTRRQPLGALVAEVVLAGMFCTWLILRVRRRYAPSRSVAG